MSAKPDVKLGIDQSTVQTSVLAEPNPADQLVDAWLIDHFGTAAPQFVTLAAREDLKLRIRAALKEG